MPLVFVEDPEDDTRVRYLNTAYIVVAEKATHPYNKEDYFLVQLITGAPIRISERDFLAIVGEEVASSPRLDG